MCARYELSATPAAIAARFSLTVPPDLVPGGEMRPTNRALVIAGDGLPRLLRWGIPALWDRKPLINARAESLAEKPAFRGLLQRRCLVPASGWVEWRRDRGGKRRRNDLTVADREIVAFAGVMDDDHFTIVTCAPAPAIAHVHDRMPVVLAKDSESRWIDPGVPFAEAEPLLRPYAGALSAAEETPAQGDLFG